MSKQLLQPPSKGDRGFLPAVDRTIMLAPLVGVVAGLGAIAFHWLCHKVVGFALESMANYSQGAAASEGSTEAFYEKPLVWMLLLVPTIGGLLSGWLVYTFAPEAEGHGTDAAIEAYHHKQGKIRKRVPLIKMLSAAITIGTGGSGGREGPIAQIGAGFGSFLGTQLNLSDQQRRVLMLAGVGAGIGAIFHAPLAGAIFAIEVLYRDPDFEAEALIPSFLSTTVAYCVFCLAYGFDTLFTVKETAFDNPMLLGPLAILAIAMAASAWLHTRIFYGTERLFKKLPVPRMLRPAIGAFATGLLAVAAYFAVASQGSVAQKDTLSVLSFGYGFLQKVLNPEIAGPESLLISVLLIVGFGKMVTTALTIGSGGSGGVFGPSMVIGGCLGAVVGLVFVKMNVIEADKVPMFAILGMASFFAAAANTPVSTLIIVSEMTGSYSLLLPSMWTCALAYLLGRKCQLFNKQVKSRLESPAHRGDFIIDVLEGMTVANIKNRITRDFITASLDMPLRDMGRLITDTRQTTFPVVDDQGKYCGLFGINDIRQILYDPQLADLAVAQDLATIDVGPLTLQMNFNDAITRFAEERFEELPVMDAQDPNKVLGLLRRQDVIAAYSTRLMEAKQTESSS